MAVILLIRHGETDYLSSRLSGRLSGIGLNEKGHRQAISLAERLEGVPLKAIYSSPLDRAVQTAAPLAEHHHLTIQTVPWLLEVDYGTLQGKTYKQLRRLKLWKTIQERPDTVRFPGGEGLCEAQARIVHGLENLAADSAPDLLVACFTHADLIRLAVAHFLNMAFNDYHRLVVSTASLTILAFEKDAPRLLCFNQSDGLTWPIQAPPSQTKAEPEQEAAR